MHIMIFQGWGIYSLSLSQPRKFAVQNKTKQKKHLCLRVSLGGGRVKLELTDVLLLTIKLPSWKLATILNQSKLQHFLDT